MDRAEGSDPDVATAESEITLSSAASSVVASPALAVLTAAAVTTQDKCAPFNDYTAAIASRVIDCLGTIDGTLFTYVKNGQNGPRLVRSSTFTKCTNKDVRVEEIDALLSLQDRTKALPLAPTCIADRWQAWSEAFQRSQISRCPTWKKVDVYTPVNADNVARAAKTEPKLPYMGDDSQVLIPHENYLFSVSYGSVKVPDQCSTPGNCARICAAGFAGFVIKADRESVVGDPTYWLVSKVYDPRSNPFLANGYYHAMSMAGDLPGSIYGNTNRTGEPCSRYMASDNTHHLSTLVKDCLNPSDASTCVSRCQNPLDPGDIY